MAFFKVPSRSLALFKVDEGMERDGEWLGKKRTDKNDGGK